MKTKVLLFLRQWWFMVLFLVAYFVVINLVVLNRFWQFEAFYMDHGFFDSAIWQVARGGSPLVDLVWKYPTHQLGDHFSPVMYLLSPLYWFTSSYEVLLVVENLFVTGAAFVLFLIAKEKIKNKLMVFALVFAFCFYIGTQNAVIANYHNDLFGMFLLSLSLLCLVKKRLVAFCFFLLLTMGLKENFAAIGIGLGIYLFFEKKRKLAIGLILFSFLYYFSLLKLIIPAIAHYTYPYTVPSHSLGSALTQLYTPPIKVEMTVASLLTFGLSPLFALSFLPTIIQDLFTRFVLNSGSARWDLGLHYNAMLSVLLTFGSILGVERLLKFQSYKRLITLHALIILGIVIVLHRFIYHGPLGLVYNRAFYAHTSAMRFEAEFLTQLPKRDFVMAQNSLGAYLTHRPKIMMLRNDYWTFMPEMIVLDLRPGQNPNAFWPLGETSAKELQKTLESDPNYQMYKVSPDQHYFLKNPAVTRQWWYFEPQSQTK